MILVQHWPLTLNPAQTLDNYRHHLGFLVQSMTCEVALCPSTRPADPNPLIDCDHSNFVRSISISYSLNIKASFSSAYMPFHITLPKPWKRGERGAKGGGEKGTLPKKESTILPDGPFGKHALSWFQWTRCSLPLKAIWMHRAFLALLETRLSAFDL